MRDSGTTAQPTTCTCGKKGVCLTCQLAELNLTPILALHRLEQRLATDPFVRDADRAHDMLESALAGSSGGLRVVT